MADDDTIRCGHFRLVERVGQGGMADVWRAEHVRRSEPAAVKIVTGLSEEPELEARFSEEVRTHANLRHPAIVQVFDHGRVTAREASASGDVLEEGQQYLAMEYADRGTVREYSRPPSWRTLECLIRSILDGLAYVHARDLVHRDLKPENILVASQAEFEEEDDEAPPLQFKLADFGITHAFDALEKRGNEGLGLEDDYFSQDAGTPIYMAPEQFFGKWQRFGPWTDLYQLGTILWELVTGEPPFRADNPYGYGYSHTREPLPDFEPELPPPEGFRAWLGALLAKAPEDRFQRAADAAWHFEQLGSGGAPQESEEASGVSHTAPTQLDGAHTTVREEQTTVRDEQVPTLAYIETSATTESPKRPSNEAFPSEGGVERSTEEMTSQTPPPLPKSWRTPEPPGPAPGQLEAGLGLFGAREVPMVDRDGQREALWRHLRAVVEEGASRVVILEGPSGAGKSRLARWIAQRAHEVGVATPLRAKHEERSRPRRGLVDLVERYFRVWGENRADAYAMVCEILDAVAGSAPSTREEDLKYDARAYTELLRPRNADKPTQGPGFVFHSERYVYSAMTELLAYVGTRRPPLVWLDDVQWGLDSLAWVDWYLERRERPPALFVLTLGAEEGEPSHDAARVWHRRRGGDERLDHLAVPPLNNRRHRRLVERILPLEAELADEVCAQTGGNPLFARQSIGVWIHGGDLVLDGDRFRPAEGRSVELPDSLHDAWLERLRIALDTFDAAQRDAAWEALELAAAIGHFVATERWESAVDRIDDELPDDLLKTLADFGLVESAAGGWQFVHTTLVDALEWRAREGDRWKLHQSRCAAILEELQSGESDPNRAVRAWYLAEADELEAAVDCLLAAAEEARRIEDFERLLDYVNHIGVWLDELDLPADDPRRLQALLLRAREAFETDLDRAAELVRRIDERLDPDEEVLLEGRLRLLEARLLQVRGDLRASTECLEGPVDALIEDGAFEIAGNLVEERGNAFHRMGDYEQAEEEYNRAHELYGQVDSDRRRARRLRLFQGQIDVECDRFEEAEKRFREAIRRSEEVGDLETLLAARNSMGESKRYQAEWEEAHSYYEAAVHWYDRLGYERQAVVARMNIVLARIGARKYEAAEEMLEEVYERLDFFGSFIVEPTAAAARLVCRSADQDWSGWDHAHLDFAEALEVTEYRHRDQPKYAEVAAELTIRAGAYERAAKLLEIVRDLWDELGDDDAVGRVDRRLDALADQV